MAVVDQLADGIDMRILSEDLEYRVHRAFDAETKPGVFGNIDFISRKTPKILILSAKLNILKKDVADESMNINPQIQNNLLRR